MGKVEVVNGYTVLIMLVSEDDATAQALQDSKVYRDLTRAFESFPQIKRIEMDIIGLWPTVTITDLDNLRLQVQLNIEEVSLNVLTSEKFWLAAIYDKVLRGVAQMMRAYEVTEIEIFK
jgi:hypothetical protein